jgi:Co/Zn/Cd efflux system component/copper chaperone CopZ
MAETITYHVTGMDCASCAAKIKRAVKSAGVDSAEISTTTQILTFPVPDNGDKILAAENAVQEAGYHLERVNADERKTSTSHLTDSYRRALWIVVILNVGFGIIEMIGGFISGSQALKADALDFIGDGAITFLGILAIGWSLVWRSRSALIQGLFLAALGIGVVGNTIYQISAGQPIDAPIMGVVAFVALLVNVAAALVLIPHRSGDTNMQAVWLFSRNDAIGNAAVVFAAVVVALSGSGWPDLIVAFAIAGLFLHSAFIIIRDALKEL